MLRLNWQLKVAGKQDTGSEFQSKAAMWEETEWVPPGICFGDRYSIRMWMDRETRGTVKGTVRWNNQWKSFGAPTIIVSVQEAQWGYRATER